MNIYISDFNYHTHIDGNNYLDLCAKNNEQLQCGN
jgi:hypothetical protein